VKVKELFENPGYTIIPEYSKLKDELAAACLRTDNKYGFRKLDDNNFNAETMYYGPKSAEFFVMYALTNDAEELDISSLYSGSDEISNELRQRLTKKPKQPTEYEMMVDCLQNEIIPAMKKHGATQVAAVRTSHHDGPHLFVTLEQFNAYAAFKEFADEINHVFFYLHFLFPNGIKLKP
jgi:hypothetical protein